MIPISDTDEFRAKLGQIQREIWTYKVCSLLSNVVLDLCITTSYYQCWQINSIVNNNPTQHLWKREQNPVYEQKFQQSLCENVYLLSGMVAN